jgi:hypothetical protein
MHLLSVHCKPNSERHANSACGVQQSDSGCMEHHLVPKSSLMGMSAMPLTFTRLPH